MAEEQKQPYVSYDRVVQEWANLNKLHVIEKLLLDGKEVAQTKSAVYRVILRNSDSTLLNKIGPSDIVGYGSAFILGNSPSSFDPVESARGRAYRMLINLLNIPLDGDSEKPAEISPNTELDKVAKKQLYGAISKRLEKQKKPCSNGEITKAIKKKFDLAKTNEITVAHVSTFFFELVNKGG